MNEVLIFYGSQKEFVKRIPQDHSNLTELVMKLDENKMKVEIQGQEINVGHMTDERRCIQWQSCLT